MRAIAWRGAALQPTRSAAGRRSAWADCPGVPASAWQTDGQQSRDFGLVSAAVAQILHLGKARKAKRRAAEQAQADQNAIQHGRTAQEREQQAAERRRHDAVLDGARREPPTPPVTDDDA